MQTNVKKKNSVVVFLAYNLDNLMIVENTFCAPTLIHKIIIA